MSTKIKKALRKIGIVIGILLVLFGGCVIYIMRDSYIIYSIKTIGQTKHKLTVYAVSIHTIFTHFFAILSQYVIIKTQTEEYNNIAGF